MIFYTLFQPEETPHGHRHCYLGGQLHHPLVEWVNKVFVALFVSAWIQPTIKEVANVITVLPLI